ncbi:MAG: peptidylprolyl isomerase [Ignavibacteriaceae bacterium]
MKKTISFLVISILFILGSNSCLTAQTDTLAIVNGKPITASDFKYRFELSIYPGKNKQHIEDAKKDFLLSMIAEKLLSNSESNSIQGEHENEELLKNEVERIFLRDALYRKEVLSKVKVTQTEVKKGIKISGNFYIIDTFYFPDSLSAVKFYTLSTKKPLRNIYSLSDSLKIRRDTLMIGYGESTENIENAFFGRNIGFISNPTYTIDGWVIFKIIKETPNKKFAGVSASDRTEMVRKIIQGRKEDELGYKYLLSVMKGVQVNINYKIFRPLVYFIKSLLANHRPAGFDPNYYLSKEEILTIKEKFSFDPRAPMLQFKGGELSLGYVLDNLLTSGFSPIDTSVGEITSSLHASLKFIVQNHFLAEKAKALGMENSPEVKDNVRIFLDAYNSARLMNNIVDTVTVSQKQINDYFENHKDEVLKDIRLRIQIFSFDNINEAAKVLNRLSQIKNAADDTTGAMWLRASQLSEMGAVLSQLNAGQIYGPIFIKGKYTIFRLLGKRSSISSEKIKSSIQVARDILVSERKNEVLNKFIANLAGEQNVKIFSNNLKNVDVTPIQMLTFRYIGFGGKIMAVPTLYPREEWIKYYNKENVLP